MIKDVMYVVDEKSSDFMDFEKNNGIHVYDGLYDGMIVTSLLLGAGIIRPALREETLFSIELTDNKYILIDRVFEKENSTYFINVAGVLVKE